MTMSGMGQSDTAYLMRLAGAIRALSEQDRQSLGRLVGYSAGQDLGLAPEEILEARSGIARLTGRELTVLRHVLAGLQNKAIANELAISHRTVEVYRARAQEKMLARNTRHMCSLAIAIGVKAISSKRRC